jgi:hypothetical protein
MDIIDVIQKNSLTVRCLPHVVISHWSCREGQKLKDNQQIVRVPKWGNREFIRDERVVENGGWWYVKETPNTDSTVHFNREYDKFFAPTLDEAIQLYLDSKVVSSEK